MNKMLVIVDYQNDFVNGALGFEGASRHEKAIKDKVEIYLKNGDAVFFTLDTHDENYLKTREGKSLPISHCQKGTLGWKLYGALESYHNDSRVTVIEKPSFGSLALLDAIEEKVSHVTQIELCGLVTNLCVISNAVLLQNKFPNAEIMIDVSCCDSYDKALHEASLSVMRGMQMTLMNE